MSGAMALWLALNVGLAPAFMFPGQNNLPMESMARVRRSNVPPPPTFMPSSSPWLRQDSNPAASTAPAQIEELRGCEFFERVNPKSDRFEVIGFHHVELWCGDASTTWRRWACGLGLALQGKCDAASGSSAAASYLLQSGTTRLVFTAPLLANGTGSAFPGFERSAAAAFTEKHGGCAVRAVALEVADCADAFAQATANGAAPVLPPTTVTGGAAASGAAASGAAAVYAEVVLYGDVVLRFVQTVEGGGDLLPRFEPTTTHDEEEETKPNRFSFGIERIDHVVGNVWELLPAANAVIAATGFHQFAEFTADDVGTDNSGLNSLVLACNNEAVLLPLNEPTYGTKRTSQIQTYLEQHQGPGVQHMALSTNDIFATIQAMRSVNELGAFGFELMARPSEGYYRDLPRRLGDSLSPDQYRQVEELGLLADKDDQGVLLQIFTRPVGDRPTLFLEIIQRIGCYSTAEGAAEVIVQAPGCGGFGKGNFRELFKSIEDYEAEIGV